MSSSSTTEPPRPAAVAPGTEIAGFRIEEARRATPESIAYVATQLSLRRRIELVLTDDPVAADRAEAGARRQAQLHHPGILTVFETGHCEHGLFVARRLVEGGTLADALAVGGSGRWTEDLAAALEAAHAAGLAHGDLRAETVLVDGPRAYLAELVRPDDLEAAVAADRAAFATLRERTRQAPPVPSPTAQLRRRRPWLLAVPVGAAALAAAVLLWPREPAAPPVAPGAVAAGSTLAGDARARDCDGREPSANSPSCTLVVATAPAGGAIRRWALRGAEGTLALQVVRHGPDGTYGEVGRSQYEVATGESQAFAADVPVRRGDLLGVEVQAGAAVGMSEGPRRALRWIGPLELTGAPRARDSTLPAAGEIQARFDIVPGARRRQPDQLRGAAARSAHAGDTLTTEEVELDSGALVRVAVVRTPSGIALDLFRGDRREARLAIPDVDPRGRLVTVEQGFATADYVRLEWRDPGAGPVRLHGFMVARDRLRIIH